MSSHIEERIAALESTKQLPEYSVSQEKSKLALWLSQWSLKRRRKSLQVARDKDGQIIEDPERASAVFCSYWKNVFSEKTIDEVLAHSFLRDFARPLPSDVTWTLPFEQFDDVIKRCRDSAAGPDGLPYSAWFHAPVEFRQTLYTLYVSLLETDLQPEPCFNNAWLVLLPKGQDESDEAVISRGPGETRPLSVSNTDCKIVACACNESLKAALPRWAKYEQRGFVMGRQLVDNVIDIDAVSHVAAAQCSDAVLALFDFANAFPSVAWAYLFLMLAYSGMPQHMARMIKKLYSNPQHYLRFMGLTTYAFTPAAGTKQGCPLSGSLFVMVLDPMISLLLSCLGPRDVVRGFADDLAAVIRNAWSTLPRVAKAFELIGKVSNLQLKVSKTVIVPLWRANHDEVSRSIVQLIPCWKGILVSGCGRYLGFYLGPDASSKSWDVPSKKWIERVHTIKGFGAGMLNSVLQYNSVAISCLGFVCQLEVIPHEILKKENQLLQCIVGGPYQAISHAALVNLCSFGLPVSFRSLAALGAAARYRTAICTAGHWRDAHKLYVDMLQSEDVTFPVAMGLSLGIFNKEPIVCTLARSCSLAHFPMTVKTEVETVVDDWRRHKEQPPSRLQKLVYDVLVGHIVCFDLTSYFKRRLQRWATTWDYFPDSTVLASRATTLLRSTFRRNPPCVISAVIKTLLNGWSTQRRFQCDERRFCKFGCDMADDSIEHYAVCEHVRNAWSIFSGLPSPNGPLGFFALGDEHKVLLQLRMAFLYCIYCIVMQLQATDESCNFSKLLARLRERKRFVMGCSAEIRRALRDAVLKRHEICSFSWPYWVDSC